MRSDFPSAGAGLGGTATKNASRSIGTGATRRRARPAIPFLRSGLDALRAFQSCDPKKGAQRKSRWAYELIPRPPPIDGASV